MTKRIPISAGNWKMNGTNAEVDALCDGLTGIDQISGVEVVVAPSFLQLARVSDKLATSGVHVAGQNMHADASGAFTGEVSPTQLREVASWVLLGHSERRQHFCESEEALNEKVRSALEHRLTPILCVGEQLDEREAGDTEAVLKRQIALDLDEIYLPDGFVIAYEPVWAIGTGKAASEVEAQDACAYIRDRVSQLFDPAKADTIRILYGGSVKPENAGTFAAQPDIDGALVGGAALDAESFKAITQAIADAKR